ncbi:MAG: hypothetical protein Q8N51_00940 [Gammaproteobacteria bacterium]|nr:hypothetical protein [Gammaproteobacteria bacterium]
MKTWTIYDKATGAIRQTFRGPAESLADQLDDSLDAVEGTVSGAEFRINQATRTPVPLPSDPEAERQSRRRAALVSINDIERRQARAIREALLGIAGAKERLTAIDAAIVAMRADLA